MMQNVIDLVPHTGGRRPSSAEDDEDLLRIHRVLVVEDSNAQRKILTSTLARWGMDVVAASSGEEALALIEALDIDFVVSDWLMPGMSGLELCEAFCSHRAGRPSYFILLTAQKERGALAEGMAKGADDFLSKPFHPTELRARIAAGQRIMRAQRVILAKNRLLTGTLDQLRELYSALDRDLEEARRLQHSLVPERFSSLERADISLLFRPSSHIGGDLVGMFRVSEYRYGLFALDVAGHGIASALLTTRLAGHFTASSPEKNMALTIDDMGLYSMHPPEKVC